MSEEKKDPHLLSVARALDRNGRRVGALETLVQQLATDVARMAGVVADLPSGEKPAPAPQVPDSDEPPVIRSWLLAAGTDGDHLPDDLADLIAWLDLVYLRFPDTVLTACWLWHPSAVEELWWLRWAHATAYDPEAGSWARVGDWHDRQRPGVARRVRETIAKCDLSVHADASSRNQVGDRPPAPLAVHAAALAIEWGRSGTRPVPSQEQLDEARDYGAASFRSRR